MLDDPKVARLNDSAYRRFVECLLLAGEMNVGGYLPPIDDMAWRLRLQETDLQRDMTRIAQAGLVELKQYDGDERWYITKFEKRQAATPKKELMQRMRDDRRRSQYYSDDDQGVTQRVTNGNVPSKTDKDTDTDKDVYIRGHTHTIHNQELPAEETPHHDDAIPELVSSLASICKQPYGPGINEDLYETTAQWCHANGVTCADVVKFGDWWKQEGNGYYKGKPAVKSFQDEIQNMMTGATDGGNWFDGFKVFDKVEDK
jgi:hypothetical protein